jgi:hypothetical protein
MWPLFPFFRLEDASPAWPSSVAVVERAALGEANAGRSRTSPLDDLRQRDAFDEQPEVRGISLQVCNRFFCRSMLPPFSWFETGERKTVCRPPHRQRPISTSNILPHVLRLVSRRVGTQRCGVHCWSYFKPASRCPGVMGAGDKSGVQWLPRLGAQQTHPSTPP